MIGVGEELAKYLKSFKPGTEFNAKELAVRFTQQNVIKCSLSVDAKSFDRQNDSEFLVMGRKMFKPSINVGLRFMAFVILPKWANDLIPVG